MRYANLKMTWPPLWSWIVFLALGVLLALTLFLMAQRSYNTSKLPATKVFKKRFEYLQQEWAKDTSPIKVIVLGHSLVRAAIHEPVFFQTNSNGRVSVYKVWVKGVRLEQFIAPYPFFEKVQALAPDYLLIDENILSWQHHAKTRDLGDYLGEFSKQLRNSLLPESLQGGKKIRSENALNFNNFHPSHQQERAANLKNPKQKWQLRNWEADALIHQQFQRLQEKGTQIYQLQIPRPQTPSERYEAAQLTDFDERNKRLFEALSIQYLKFSDTIPLNHYRDHAHLNFKGTQAYSSWLLDQISSWNY